MKEVLILRMKIRFITEIMRENISYCERIMEIAEVPHLDEVKHNFGIVDGVHYGGIAKVQETDRFQNGSIVQLSRL